MPFSIKADSPATADIYALEPSGLPFVLHLGVHVTLPDLAIIPV
jgi:hypothetical protein